ncbi:hypothetical protein B0A50_05687 [Salinomyces thailandicus]|uniref:Uncharacterized protein n=1 Tax=Salinomyces thailandicus TaxID=706561 RepID=A0A4V5N3R5_9PEZI|nr:hypothetical protein B0A50_05687 [Salinomyces thailandica]
MTNHKSSPHHTGMPPKACSRRPDPQYRSSPDTHHQHHHPHPQWVTEVGMENALHPQPAQGFVHHVGWVENPRVLGRGLEPGEGVGTEREVTASGSESAFGRAVAEADVVHGDCEGDPTTGLEAGEGQVLGEWEGEDGLVGVEETMDELEIDSGYASPAEGARVDSPRTVARLRPLLRLAGRAAGSASAGSASGGAKSLVPVKRKRSREIEDEDEDEDLEWERERERRFIEKYGFLSRW